MIMSDLTTVSFFQQSTPLLPAELRRIGRAWRGCLEQMWPGRRSDLARIQSLLFGPAVPPSGELARALEQNAVLKRVILTASSGAALQFPGVVKPYIALEYKICESRQAGSFLRVVGSGEKVCPACRSGRNPYRASTAERRA
jgi:hypothetical protein